MKELSPARIIVIGSGVIGLSAALCLRAGRSAFCGTCRQTSMAAGAVWSGISASGREQRWAAATLARFLPLTKKTNSGVSLQRIREVFPQPEPDPWFRPALPYFERLRASDLPAGMADGFLLALPVVAPPLYLQNLQAQFQAAGGAIEEREVNSLAELADAAPLLVNCSGVGARQLAADESVYPIRGQTILLTAPQIREGYIEHKALTYLFPRPDGLLIGGTIDEGSWNTQLDPASEADIFERCAAVESAVAAAPVLRQRVGLRPGRARPRLELEEIAPNCAVIHNYGHGGVGYTLSWGCAENVLQLARTVL